MSRNRLSTEISPYLLQHKDNPVHWHPWDPETLAHAKAVDKPILLSIGYAACHWCHVMAHESFEDQAVADVMNALFISIKVDREERPDIDTIYQSALALLGQSGGWPLTMFLTPDGEPFWGGTYFPRTTRWGRPGFVDVMQQVATAYETTPGRIARNVRELRAALEALSSPAPGEAIALTDIESAARILQRQVDPVHGGFGRAPKFPQVSFLDLLWRAHLRTGCDATLTSVLRSLDGMCQGGIHDHLAGGFARYSTDDEWLAPHFEKMLYDNALLLDFLLTVAARTNNPLYRQRVEETADWTLREMVAESGGFAASLDADSEGEEGRFYVWSEAEIEDVLTNFPKQTVSAFMSHYDVTTAGNWETKVILNRRLDKMLADAETESAMTRCRAALLVRRDKRVRPDWDDKVLADWNGLMITAMARAARVFRRDDWAAAAKRAYTVVATEMTVDGRLRHSYRDGRLRHPATLDDYANMIRAALSLYEVNGDDAALDQAEVWLKVVDDHYWDAANGGYYFTADDTDDVILRTKTALDNAVPAGNSIMLENLARLFHLTGDPGLKHRAEALMRVFSGDLERYGHAYATLLNAAELLENPRQVVLVQSPAGTGPDILEDVLFDNYDPARIIFRLRPGAILPRRHPAHGKSTVDGKPTAYVCTGQTCSPPITVPATLIDVLRVRPGTL